MRPEAGAPLEVIEAWAAQYSDVANWPDPSPEQIEQLRALFGYAGALPAGQERRAS
jgi:hypothetical protein